MFPIRTVVPFRASMYNQPRVCKYITGLAHLAVFATPRNILTRIQPFGCKGPQGNGPATPCVFGAGAPLGRQPSRPPYPKSRIRCASVKAPPPIAARLLCPLPVIPPPLPLPLRPDRWSAPVRDRLSPVIVSTAPGLPTDPRGQASCLYVRVPPYVLISCRHSPGERIPRCHSSSSAAGGTDRFIGRPGIRREGEGDHVFPSLGLRPSGCLRSVTRRSVPPA